MSLTHLKRMPTVRVAMTPFPYSIDIDAPAEEAWEAMLEHEIRHLPVTSGGQLEGLISERDLRLVLRPGVEREQVKVRDACHGKLYCIPDDTPLDEVLTVMAERHIGSAVVHRGGHLAGILTVTDVCRHLAEVLRAHCGAPGTRGGSDEPPSAA